MNELGREMDFKSRYDSSKTNIEYEQLQKNLEYIWINAYVRNQTYYTNPNRILKIQVQIKC